MRTNIDTHINHWSNEYIFYMEWTKQHKKTKVKYIGTEIYFL